MSSHLPRPVLSRLSSSFIPISRSVFPLFSCSSFSRSLHISAQEKRDYAKRYPYKVVPLSALPVQFPRQPSQPHYVTLNVESRDAANKYISSYLRNERARIPAIFYLRKDGTQNKTLLSIDLKEFQRVQQFYDTAIYCRVFELYIDSSDKPVKALVKKIDVHPITGQLLNVAFIEYREDIPIRLAVPINIVGDDQNLALVSETATMGVNRLHADIIYQGKSENLPQAFLVNVKDVMPGQALRMQDLELPSGCQLYKPKIPQTILSVFITDASDLDEEEPAPAAKTGAAAGAGAAGAAKAPAGGDKAAGGEAKKDDKAAAAGGDKAAPAKKK